MFDSDSDVENMPLSTTHTSNASPSICSSLNREEYQPRQLERLLKTCTNSKNYIVVKNLSPLIKSDVWKIFGFPAKLRIDGHGHDVIPNFVSCFDCFKTLSFDGSTKYMIKHKCLDAASAGRAESMILHGTIDKYLSKKVSIQKQDKDKMKDKLVIWTCSSIRPFTIVEDPGFLDVLNEGIRIGQKYSNPINAEDLIVSAKTVGNNVGKLAEQYRSLLIPILQKQAEDGCLCIIPDLWSDKHRKISYIGITCTFVSGQFKHITIDLCCAEFDEYDKSGASLFLSIRKQLQSFNLEIYFDNKKLIFVSDRGSNIKKALEGQDTLFCFGHRINNVLQRTFYQIVPKTKEESRATTTTPRKKRRIQARDLSNEENSSEDDEVYRKPSPSKQPEATTTLSSLPVKPKELLDMISASKAIVKYVKLTNINYEIVQNHGVALQQSNITRWISLSSLLSSVEASLEHVRSIISAQPAIEKQKINLTRINIEGLKDLATLLKTFEEVIVLIQHGDRPSLHMVYVGLNKLKLHLSGEDIDSDGTQIIIDDRHEGTDFFRKRLKQMLFLMFQLDKKHLAGALLHPLYRKLTFVNDYQRSKTHIYVRRLLTELYGYGINQSTNNPTLIAGETKKTKHQSIEDQFVDPDDDDDGGILGLNSTHQANDELDKYLRMSIGEQYKSPNPLIFWQSHQDKLPYLSKLARRLFSIPATSAGVERQFSAGGLLINERRSSLNPDTVENVLFVRSMQKVLKNNPDLFST